MANDLIAALEASTKGQYHGVVHYPKPGSLRMAQLEFCAAILEKFPSLEYIFEWHVANHGGIIPYALLMDINVELFEAFVGRQGDISDWEAYLAFMEDSYRDGDQATKVFIATGFVEELPLPDDEEFG